MQGRDREARCVFCGRAIAPGEPSVGRGAVAAHSACADRSLADDRSWDRIAEALGDGAPADDPAAAEGDPVGTDVTGRNGSDTSESPVASTSGGRSGAAAARTGCLTIAVLAALGAWSVVDHARGSGNDG